MYVCKITTREIESMNLRWEETVHGEEEREETGKLCNYTLIKN